MLFCYNVIAKEFKRNHNMPDRLKRPIRKVPSWQTYQAGLKRVEAHRRLKKKIIQYSPFLPILIVATYGIIVSLSGTACQFISPFSKLSPEKQIEVVQNQEIDLFEKKEVQAILGNRNLMNLKAEYFSVDYDKHLYQVDTSLQIPLQNYLLKKMDPSTSRYIGIVVMEPSTGRILAMTGFDKTDKSNNPCIDSRFPAASIFKIVTAAAGVEKCGFSSGSNFTFNGGKYTLYKYQLKDRNNKYTNNISFRDSFAQSVNPVFGKIGALYLGKDYLEEYANAFGFNQYINFEIPFPQSRVSVSDESYQWAEIACGFNRQTVMSPLHGALLGATIVNDGILMEPTIVDRINDEKGNLCYKSEPKAIGLAVTPRVSHVVNKLMRATITSGTSRKTFRGSRRDRVLKKLYIGGKTGSIGSRKIQHMRYDWFVGFAEEKKGKEKLVVSVVVAHEKYIGKRAGYYARIIIKEYFRNYYRNQNPVMQTKNQTGPKPGKQV